MRKQHINKSALAKHRVVGIHPKPSRKKPSRNPSAGIDSEPKSSQSLEAAVKTVAGGVGQSAPGTVKTWLVTCAVTLVPDSQYPWTLTHKMIVKATDMRAAESRALDIHVNDRLGNDLADDVINGDWGTFRGLRAFFLSDSCPPAFAGSALWIESVQEINSGDAEILKPYLLI